jgi:hypothetical protein
VPTADGDLWFKEAAPSLAFEPALTELVARRRPNCAPEVLASEGARMLTRDAGPGLRALLEAGNDIPAWEEIVAHYAELQIDLADEVDALLALGVPDSRPETLRQVVAGPLRATLIHEEATDGNIHVRDGRPVFIDWAEASVSHPFAGLTNTLRAVGPERAPRIRDAYLEPWTRYAPLPELREIFAAAYALGCLCRSSTWRRIVSTLPPDSEARLEYTHNVTAWLEIHAEAREHPDRLGV